MGQGDVTPEDDINYDPDDDILAIPEANTSSLSLGSSQYSNFGDEDITQLIQEFPLTQLIAAENAPVSSTSSSNKSLGKRKAAELSASDLSVASSSSSLGLFRPAKIQRLEQIRGDEESNPFLVSDTPKEDPYAPLWHTPSPQLQARMDKMKLPYCVQYEIARCVSKGTHEYKTINIPGLTALASYKTNEATAPHIPKMLSKSSFEEDDNAGQQERFKAFFAKEHAARSPWKELDREEEALRMDPYGALGFNSLGESVEWYGGKVLFHGKLSDLGKKNTPVYKLVLEAAALGPSNMFSRRFGSQHIFRLKLTKGVQGRNADDLVRYLERPLFLCGSVFRALFAKESNVFYVRTNEIFDQNGIDASKTKPGMMSFLDFLKWHNSIEHNYKQKMAKFVSRYALGLSNSVPGLLIHQANIDFIDDIISHTGANMTDGAGKINRWSLLQIRRRLGWEDKPTAIQVRIHGAKGLLVDDGRNADEFGFVQLTPSQRKIQFPAGVDVDPAHRIIDVIRPSHLKTPCRLSVEVIINMAENGVPKEAFVDLLQQSLSELVEPLLDWYSDTAMIELWCNVRRLGGVMAARRAREQAGAARALGYSERDANDDQDVEDEDGFAESDLVEEAQQSSKWWGDEVSGCPSSLEETVMCLLDSNFTPQDSPILREKLRKFIPPRVNEYVRSFRMEVPMSASAFLVPDTEGILEEGEVFFKSSRREFRLPDGTETDVITGPVLVTRNPCKLPTDVRKMTAVDRPGLHHMVDVIVFSTKGSKRAADWLGGGDYDGDKGQLIYQPELVTPFQNAPDHLADPPTDLGNDFPKDIEDNFLRKNEDVEAFLSRIKTLSTENKIREMQEFLLGDARNAGVVGQYSNFHEYSTYTRGYRHSETLRLAHIFCMALDGVKTGKMVDPEIFRQDKLRYDNRAPKWKEFQDKTVSGPDETNQSHPRRIGLRKFIMDQLMEQCVKKRDDWLTHITTFFDEIPRSVLDEHLAAPWKEAALRAARWAAEKDDLCMTNELKALQDHVVRCYNAHRNEMRQKSPSKARATPSKIKSSDSFTDQPIEVRQNTLRKHSQEFASLPLPGTTLSMYMSEEEISRVRASYAYVYDNEMQKNRGTQNFTRFPFDVAMRELCAIKARATGRHKTVSGDFYDRFNIKHPKKHHH
ncbi:RNA dependent RNA polymerase-domain-containing protein [Crepidotus variabilis]|uniref:RNA-dependent RNA polymerase n=1 Tax=Crepidotus variabilis TaxID=179855 RepID=A0A9P6JVQ5_9AGAR|nr:RNA dependent RNA polymerase-domain-containing protein [Crepidotus variabilis]